MKNWFKFLKGEDDNKSNSAQKAKERLQILIAKDGCSHILSDDVIKKIEYEILEIVKKYIQVNEENIDIKVENDNGLEILGLNITLNEDSKLK